jgi:hypothetical protein
MSINGVNGLKEAGEPIIYNQPEIKILSVLESSRFPLALVQMEIEAGRGAKGA